ncbi:hypothetical protein ACN4DP_10645, partial [Corynebacterium macclintockiae]|uniref:hypothetical protein n=1 Tax=Corynebacterium macclintockiae TaxID=2913501 RepID=UPI003EC02906
MTVLNEDMALEKYEARGVEQHLIEKLGMQKPTGATTKVGNLENEVSRVLFLGLCLDFHYFSTGVVFPKFGFDFSRRAVAQALVEP